MTHALKPLVFWVAATIIASGVPTTASADDKSFERVYEVQQKGYSDYYRALINGKGKGSGGEASLRKQYIEPAQEAGKKAFNDAGKKIVKDVYDSAKDSRAHFAKLREAEKTGKKPDKSAPSSESARDPAAKSAKQFESKPEREKKPSEVIDGKGLQDEIEF